VTGNAVWDGAASLVIGIILIGVAIFLAFENYSLLIGESAPAGVEAKIRRTVEREEGVEAVADLRTLHVGPHAILVALGLRFSPDLSVPEVEKVVGRLHTRIKAALAGATDARLIVIEPSRGATPRSPARRPGAAHRVES
jgi:divalent metal cation (Fe/Co/Zn/Cd) transporter